MYLASPGRRAPAGQGAGLVLLELKESQELLVFLEGTDSLVLRGLRAHQVSVAQLDQLESKDRGACQDLSALQDYKDHRDNQESQSRVQ